MGRRRAKPQPVADRAQLTLKGFSHERVELAVRVGELRTERNWSWNDLAKAAHLGAHQIEGIESATRDPTFTTLVRLARGLGLDSLDRLLQPPCLPPERVSGESIVA